MLDDKRIEDFMTRFIDAIEVDQNGCWLWTKGCSNGYGIISLNYKIYFSHRISYMIHVEDISDDLVIDHLCRVKRCSNPEHLEAVPQRINVLRGIGPSAMNSKKTHCPKGHAYDGISTKGYRICKDCMNGWKTRNRRRIAMENI